MNVKIIRAADIDDEFIQNWARLFSIAFNKNRLQAEELFRKKYEHEKNVLFAVLEEKGFLIACYGGVILDGLGGQIFLSMDTMALKTVKHGTTTVAAPLYDFLRSIGVLAVVGFPNPKIIKIRTKFLDWQIAGQLNCYIGIPIRSKFLQKKRNPYLWELKRPKEGFYNRKYTFIANLYSSNKMYAAKWYKPFIALEAEKPGPLFLKLPNFFGFGKQFGFCVLSVQDAARNMENLLHKCATELDVECIDVP